VLSVRRATSASSSFLPPPSSPPSLPRVPPKQTSFRSRRSIPRRRSRSRFNSIDVRLTGSPSLPARCHVRGIIEREIGSRFLTASSPSLPSLPFPSLPALPFLEDARRGIGVAGVEGSQAAAFVFVHIWRASRAASRSRSSFVSSWGKVTAARRNADPRLVPIS